jgi:hypothetical protein
MRHDTRNLAAALILRVHTSYSSIHAGRVLKINRFTSVSTVLERTKERISRNRAALPAPSIASEISRPSVPRRTRIRRFRIKHLAPGR